jgi:hypothetical protein
MKNLRTDFLTISAFAFTVAGLALWSVRPASVVSFAASIVCILAAIAVGKDDDE